MVQRQRSTGVAYWLAAMLASAASPCAQGLEGKELRAALKDTAADFWIYDDLKAAYRSGRETGKPLLVSFRCVP